MDPARAVYDETGALMCPACAAGSQIAEGDARAISSLVRSAIGVLIGGILSWTCLNMFFVLSVVTIFGGLGWLLTIGRSSGLRDRLGNKLVPCILAACFGVLLGGAPLLFMALGIAASSLGH